MKKNKFIKRILLSAVFMMLSIVSQAQSADEIKRPSANAQQFTSIASSGIGLHTGQLSVNIPLFTLQSKGIDVPVSLAFSGGEVTHQSEASPVGLGWSLLAGGVISVTIRDKEDTKTSSKTKIPWQYDRDYLTRKWDEQAHNIYTYPNKFDEAMNLILSGDYAPDSYKYTFQGYSGDIVFTFDGNDKLQGKLYPDETFKISKTTEGYKIITDDGIQYYFECKEYNCANNVNAATCFFLSEIKTPQGGHVTFTYTDETDYDLRQEIDLGFAGYGHPQLKKKRLTRIDSEFGYALLNADRPNVDHVPNPLQILGIELHDKQGVLIKGYELNRGTDSFTNSNKASNASYNSRLKLDNVKEYDRDGNFLPGYYFKYDYYFARAKDSYKYCQSEDFNCARASWAKGPGLLAVVDRNVNGEPACWMEYPNTPNQRAHGFDTMNEYWDDTVDDYFCLTEIKFPTGRREAYTYEPHDYSHVGTTPEVVDPPTGVIGRRLLRKIISDTDGTNRYVDYKYKLHDANYAIPKNALSSGVLVAPSFHTSVMYKPVSEDSHRRFVATTHNTHKPQNCLEGPVVCYTEIEEIYRSFSDTLGRKIYYFDKVIADPAMNYVYTNYNYTTGERGNLLMPVPNRLYGTLKRYPSILSPYDNVNMAYIAYPVGQFSYPVRTVGKVMKELTFASDGALVKKVVNEYNHGTSQELYGFLVCKFTDSSSSGSLFEANRYLISQTTHYAVYSRLAKSVATDYISVPGVSATDSITEVRTWNYSGSRLLSTSRSLGNDESVTTENIYPDQIRFDTQTGLSAQAFALKSMVGLNMINFPVQTVKKKGNKYLEGSFFTYRQALSTCYVADSVFRLGSGTGSLAQSPYVNVQGKVVRHEKFVWEQAYTSYDEDMKPVEVTYKNRPTTYFKWGHGGRYIIAKVDNYTSAQVATDPNLRMQLSILATCKGASNELYNCNKSMRSTMPANVMVTTYTYNPMVGVTSETDPSGNTIYYEYDNFGRLRCVRDRGNCVIENVDYYLAN